MNTSAASTTIMALAYSSQPDALKQKEESEKMPLIARLFRLRGSRSLCADWGIRLMNLDATIMVAVMQALVAHPRQCRRAGAVEGQARAEMQKSWAQNAKGPILYNTKRKTATLSSGK